MEDVSLNRGVAEDTSLLRSDSALSSEWVTRLLDPEHEGILILQIVVNCSPNITVSNPRGPEFSAIPL